MKLWLGSFCGAFLAWACLGDKEGIPQEDKLKVVVVASFLTATAIWGIFG